MLAHTFKPDKHKLSDTCYSEKLDGQRAIWLPWTRGIPKSDIPFANCAKDGRLIDEQIATGLWSRLGNIIHPPEYWLDQLPDINLDSELYSDSLRRQDLMSIVKKFPKNRDDQAWDEVKLFVFDSPRHDVLMADGVLTTTNFEKTFKDCREWAVKHGAKKCDLPSPAFLSVQANLKRILPAYPRCVHVLQTLLPSDESEARRISSEALDAVTDRGGEGLMCRFIYSNYQCARAHSLLKLKKLNDDDGIVIGYITGRKTGKGSRLLGKMGALVLRLSNGKQLELSGFTDQERRLTHCQAPDTGLATRMEAAEAWAMEYPEQHCPDWIEAMSFPRGSKVTFRYRGTSRDGIPNEARYYRKRLDE